MTDPEKRICRYFNTLGGCWYADNCKFLHIPNKKPPCKFHGSSSGCRYGESCHFSHDKLHFKAVDNFGTTMNETLKETFKENLNPAELLGTNNNSSMTLLQPTSAMLQIAPNDDLSKTTRSMKSQNRRLISENDDSVQFRSISDCDHHHHDDLQRSQSLPTLPLLRRTRSSSSRQSIDSSAKTEHDDNNNQENSTTTEATIKKRVNHQRSLSLQPIRRRCRRCSSMSSTTAAGLKSPLNSPTTNQLNMAALAKFNERHGLHPSHSLRELQARFIAQHEDRCRKQGVDDGEEQHRQHSGVGQKLLAELQSSNNSMLLPSSTLSQHQHFSQYGQLVNQAGDNVVSASEVEVYCGSCRRALKRQANESYCTLLKDHYLDCFLDKEGDHVKCVKVKAALEPGQMYWCKSCILIFEKPWSLFQHMADKAKGSKVQRWEKKMHLDWMDNVAGLMAGYDLGLFSPAKLRVDLRNLLADQHTIDEDIETAALTAAAMMHWFAPLSGASSPWRLQQREMMRKLEQLNRQMVRKTTSANSALALLNTTSSHAMMNSAMRNGGGGMLPAPMSNATSGSSSSMNGGSRNWGNPSSTNHRHEWATDNCRQGGQPYNAESDRKYSGPSRAEVNDRYDSEEFTSRRNQNISRNKGDERKKEHLNSQEAIDNSDDSDSNKQSDEGTKTGASGDEIVRKSALVTETDQDEKKDSNPESGELSMEALNSNNTNSASWQRNASGDAKYQDNFKNNTSASNPSNRPNSFGPRVKSYHGNAPPYNNYYNSYRFNNNANEPYRFQRNFRGFRPPFTYGHPSSMGFGPRPRGGGAPGYNHRHFRMPFGPRNAGNSSYAPKYPYQNNNTFNPPSFHASLDLNCGFTNDEVEELMSQGIKPWDSEAGAALAVLHGEMDHLLD